MAENKAKQQEPDVLLLVPWPSKFLKTCPMLEERFRLVTPTKSESCLITTHILHNFLKTHGETQSIRAMVCHGRSGAITIDTQILDCLPALECIVNAGVGVNHIDMIECRRRGITVTNAGSAFSPDVADSAVGLLLDVLRSVSASDRYVRSGLWPVKGDFPLAHKTNAQSIRAMLCECGVGAIPINAQMLDCLPALKCIVNSGVGTDHIDLSECSQRGITVTNAGSAFSPDVADSAVGLLLDVLRRVSLSDRYVRSGLWPIKGDFPLAHKIGGKRVGIVGLGSIGSEVAKRLEAFGCSIAYNSRKKKDCISFPYYSTINDLATNSDVLILCCSLTDETYHIINKEVLSLLGKDGIIINVGRGALIDEKELLRCLVQGEIGGAGLDVFENEPDVPIDFFQLDNVVMTPHNAVLTPESFAALHELMVANLEAFFSNKPLLSPVN